MTILEYDEIDYYKWADDNKPLVLRVDSSGNPYKWVTAIKSSYFYAKGLVAWESSQDYIPVYGGVSDSDGVRSIMMVNSIIAIKGKTSDVQLKQISRVPITNKMLYLRDDYRCAYCGLKFTSKQLSRDHVIPISKGGLDVWENLVSCCKKCNRSKDNKLLEHSNMSLMFNPYKPTKAEYLILQNRNITPSQLEFLLKYVSKTGRIYKKYNSIGDHI